MIISENKKPTINDFRLLMSRTDEILNSDAVRRPGYYAQRAGNLLEDDVCDALNEGAKNTPFANTIVKVSGQKFPDIVAGKYYGVEVKSTKADHWKSTGSSILETTRVQGVERIYMTFGKLGGKPAFLSKPYEECLSGIAVTHMPRYLIDMRVDTNDTIFAKMGIEYETLRRSSDPVSRVAEYYKRLLKPGESLWWTGSTDETVSAKIRLWKTLSLDEKRICSVYGLVNYPEIFAGNYDRYSLWLTSQGIVDPHIRDQFSAGGQEQMKLSNGQTESFPAIYRRVKKYYDLLYNRLYQKDPTDFAGNEERVSDDEYHTRVRQWIEQASEYAPVQKDRSIDALNTFFFDNYEN